MKSTLRRRQNASVLTEHAVAAPIVVAGNPHVAALKRFQELSPREREIALRIAQGQRQAQTASELGISIKTIATHRERVLQRLQLKSNAQIAVLAYMAGLVACP